MSNPNWPSNWPKAVPFPTAIGRRGGPVPNRQSVDWPQSQLAPLYLPPGSPSFQPYRYPEGGAMPNLLPELYRLPADAMPFAHSMVGPGGDINQLPDALPSSYGESMPLYARRNQGEVPPEPPILDVAQTDAIILAADPTQLPEVALEQAAIAAETAITTASALVPEPFTEEQMKGLRPRTKARLKRLDKALANLAAIEARTARQDFWFEKLSKLHSRIDGRLDARAARQGKPQAGKRAGWLQQFMMARKERRDETPFTKKEAVARVTAALRDRLIDRETAARLVRGVLAGDPRAMAIVKHPIVARVVF